MGEKGPQFYGLGGFKIRPNNKHFEYKTTNEVLSSIYYQSKVILRVLTPVMQCQIQMLQGIKK